MADISVNSSWETTDVVICGCGPTGAMLSASLGQLRVNNIVLEREPGVNTDPRGIALDEDGIRSLQGVGIYEKIFSEIGRCMEVFNFVGGTEHRLNKAPFTRLVYRTTEGGTGHVGFLCHKQPVLEANLRSAMSATEHSILRSDSTLTSISEDEEWVYVTYNDKNGDEHRLRSKFFVGADGKTGFTRKKYLEPRGVIMEQASATSYHETWVALNWKMKFPTPETHPEYPLWKLGYTPEQVYDLFFPEEFRFLCNPKRPAVCGRFGLPEDQLWRFEFVVQKEEDGTEMAKEESVRRIVHPYITHPGSRYGLPGKITYPDDCIEVLRCRPFGFSARSCNKWALGRVILCGDSAHVFPPFGGQGIASGFRDACALAWRLQVACSPGFKNHQALLSAWYTERKQQLERSLAATVENGKYVTEGNWLKIMIRDTQLWLLQLIPSWRHWLEMGQRREGMVRYEYEPGMAFLPNLGGGICLPQVYCVPLASKDQDEEVASVAFTDDVIFAAHKRGLFQLVVILDSTEGLEDARSSLSKIDTLSAGQILASEATFIVQDPAASNTTTAKSVNASNENEKSSIVYRIATASTFAKSHLCKNRPEPEFFDEYRMSREVHGKRFVILRPDRFVFAACSEKSELEHAVQQISPVLNGDAILS